MKTRKVSLNVRCPYCQESLMDDDIHINDRPSIKIRIETDDDTSYLWLSSIYGDYSHNSPIEMKPGIEVDFYCPHCNELLNTDLQKCYLCGSSMVSFVTNVGGRVSICSRYDCENHYLVFDNIENQIMKFYTEYGCDDEETN
jgi:hypothetical protein